jgi:multiple sugar transport system permease protein
MKVPRFENRIKRRDVYGTISILLITFFALLSLFPLYWLATSSFKVRSEIFAVPPTLWPQQFTIRNFETFFVGNPTFTWLLNSIMVSLATCLIMLIAGTMAAYAFSKLSFKGRRLLFLVFVSSIMLPIEVMIVPLFQIVSHMGLHNTILGMSLPGAASAVGLFMLKGFIDSIPNSMRESAKIDGANEFTVFLKIILPMAKPGIGALFILTFVSSWNNYLWQLLIGTRRETMTLMVGLGTLFNEYEIHAGVKIAAAFIGAIPMLIVFFAFQKYFTRGITLGAVKG